eukprot:scaffold182510_cov18-Tisochrysis_lutea.AAC.1
MKLIWDCNKSVPQYVSAATESNLVHPNFFCEELGCAWIFHEMNCIQIEVTGRGVSKSLSNSAVTGKAASRP